MRPKCSLIDAGKIIELAKKAIAQFCRGLGFEYWRGGPIELPVPPYGFVQCSSIRSGPF